jgi:hypothetical protein
MSFTESQLNHMNKLVAQYQRIEEKLRRKGGGYVPGLSSYEESKWMHQEMANGGDGGTAGSGLPGEGTIRSEYYPGYPNAFFQELCDRMRWNWRGYTH